MHEKDKIIQGLVDFEKEIDQNENSKFYTLTPEANNFLFSNANAFLFGVLFDQGISAEKAWEAPHMLRERLGFWDIKEMHDVGIDRLVDIVKQKPALHRYHYLGEWVWQMCKTLLEKYKGDAENIWYPQINAKKLIDRLLEFKGIGQKKANMAAILLYRDFNIKITKLEDIDVPYDIHIRRVFLRTGLIENDLLKEVIAVGRDFYPEYPGFIDQGAWHVGRDFCRPKNPNCVTCPLRLTCPKLTFKGLEMTA